MKQRKPMNPSMLIALIVVGVTLFGIVGWFVAVRPQGAKVKDLKSQAADVQKRIDDYNQKVQAARSRPEIRVADVYRLAKAMPSKPDMPDLLLELSQLARDTGIEFQSITPSGPTAVDSYTKVAVAVTFNGNFYSLADFLYRLRSLVTVHREQLLATGRLFTVDSVILNEGPDHFPQVQASLTINAFVYGSVVPAAPTPATPAATDTTSTTTTTDASTTTTTSTTSTPSTGASATGAP